MQLCCDNLINCRRVSSETVSAPKPRLGGRSARVRQAVLDAAFAELDEHGYADFSIEAVARRSGVHKTTIYRRWPTREALLVYALDTRSDRDLPTPNAGSLRAELQQFGKLVLAKLTSTHGNALLKSLVSAADQSPDVREKVGTFWQERLDAGAAVLSRGVDRGELPPDIKADLLIEAFLAPIYLRVLFSQAPVTEEFLGHLSDVLLDGAVTRFSAHQTSP
jgi:AcrR family transcriptional regulator